MAANRAKKQPPPAPLHGAAVILSWRWVVPVLSILTVLVYAGVWNFDFVNWDDPQFSQNPSIAGGLTWQSVRWAFVTHTGSFWLPLNWLSHMLDVDLYGLLPGPHHLTNLLLHIANSLLLFGLLSRLTGAAGRSAFVAAVFAVHPLHVESVAWVTERKDVLSTLFGLLTIWAYLAYLRHPHVMRYVAMMILFILALMAKPMLVTLPLLLLLLDSWPLDRLRPRTVVEKLPLLALSAAAGLVTLVFQRQGGALVAAQSLSWTARIANALVSYVSYIATTLWPANLAALYPYRPAPLSLAVAAALLLVIVSASVLWTARGYPYLTVGWLWYLIALIPVAGLVQTGVQPRADRFMYLPLIGIAIMAAWGIWDLCARWTWRRIAVPATACAVLASLAIAAHLQVESWRNDTTLWEHCLAVDSENEIAHAKLANDFANQGRIPEAIDHYSEALRLNGMLPEVHNELGIALAEQGRIEEALAHYRTAVNQKPDYVEAHTNLGVAFASLGQGDQAVREFETALRLNPNAPDAHNNLGVALAGIGRIGDAVREYREAVRLKPDFAEARKNLEDAQAHQP